MTYDPTTYWPERYAAQGDVYVAKAGRHSSHEKQLEAVPPFFAILPTSGSVLDFGCGPQRFRPALEAHGLTYYGYDLIDGLGTVDGLEPERYDAAVALFVLQHIPPLDHGEALDTLYAALVPGGTLLAVDHEPLDEMDDHMAGALGFRRVADAHDWEAELVGHWNRHWVGVFTK